MFRKVIFILLCLFFVSPAYAAEDCPIELEKTPILQGGRVKPLRVHARETIKFITGKSKWQNQSATQVYCELSLQKITESKARSIPILVNHIDTKKFLGLSESAHYISYEEALKKEADLRQYAMTLEGRKDSSTFAKDLKAVLTRLQIQKEVIGGENWKIPLAFEKNVEMVFGWKPLKEWASTVGLTKAPAAKVSAQILKEGENYTNSQNTHVIEYHYDKWQLFHWSILAVLLSLAFTTLSKKNHPLLIVSLVITFAMEVAAIVFRVMISGRGPVTNMYETVMWVGIGGLFFATILYFFRQDKLYLRVGLGLNLACLFMMTFATDMLNPSIQPLVPVLRDNFWLSTHVTSITISYAALALSWVLANYFMVRSIITPNDNKFTRRIGELCYDCIKIGVTLLALGIILGGVWADYSWGRFWGWDPKETWSLIALLIYIAILHGRFTGWITPTRFIPLSGLAFLSVMMAWFGVNYILAAGLHSYGFSEGGSLFLMSFFGLQILIFLTYGLRNPKFFRV